MVAGLSLSPFMENEEDVYQETKDSKDKDSSDMEGDVSGITDDEEEDEDEDEEDEEKEEGDGKGGKKSKLQLDVDKEREPFYSQMERPESIVSGGSSNS